jgi:MFS superfamily sulfate permease-like transporter
LWRLSRPQFVTAWLTFFATLVFSPRLDYAILLGISASLLIHLYREMDLEIDSYYEDDTLYVVLSGVLWFGSTQRLEDALTAIFERQVTINNLTIDARGLGHTDLSGAMALVDSLRDARAQGINLEIQGVSPRLAKLLKDLERVQP